MPQRQTVCQAPSYCLSSSLWRLALPSLRVLLTCYSPSWLPTCPPTYPCFSQQELILFSRADLERSIPCMVDGLKPGQRKIMFACFKRNLKSDIKVAQLSGYVAEHSGAGGGVGQAGCTE